MTRRRTLRWTPAIWAGPHPVSPARVRAAGRRLGVDFPPDYVRCVARYQGMRPVPGGFDLGHGDESAIQDLLHFCDDESVANLIATVERLELPAGLIPVASDPLGNFVCLDFRGAAPVVVFWDHDGDDDTLVLADSFDEFLSGLHG